MFVFRPELLMLDRDGGLASAVSIVVAVLLAVLGIIPLAAGIAGYLRRPLGWGTRAVLLASAALALYPGKRIFLPGEGVTLMNLVGIALFLAVLALPGRRRVGADDYSA